jgi:chromate transporter
LADYANGGRQHKSSEEAGSPREKALVPGALCEQIFQVVCGAATTAPGVTLRALPTPKRSNGFPNPMTNVLDVFLAFLRLGLTSFGGPVAHLGFFREEFVVRRRWLDETSYADVVALCQFLPGPASSQVGMALGRMRAGTAGAFAAWCGFTLPSAVVLVLLAKGLASHAEQLPNGLLHGLKVAIVAVVAQAVWGMAKSLCPDLARKALMLAAAAACLCLPTTPLQLAVMLLAGVIGLLWLRVPLEGALPPLALGTKRGAAALLVAFLLLFGTLPILAALLPSPLLQMVEAFYRTGALVFGGGHVVLPLLQAEMVPTGLVSNETLLAGYAAAQAVPGPLFTFAAFLGASVAHGAYGWAGGLVGLLAIFVPGWLLVLGTAPFWESLRRNTQARAALAGVNAAVVGMLLAALVDPVWTSAIHAPKDLALALVALLALQWARWPVWAIVPACGMAGIFGAWI